MAAVNSSIINQIDTEIARLKAVRKCVANAIDAGTSPRARLELRRARRIRGLGSRARIRLKGWPK